MANFDSIPDNIILEILNYLPVKELCLVGRVCRRWRRVARDNSLWRYVDLTPYRLNLRKMWKVIRSHLSECLHTLKLRGGFDETLSDKNPLSDAMLKDLQERCPNVKHITLHNCKLYDLEMKLPTTLTSIELNHCSWKPRWFENIHSTIPDLTYLSFELTTRVDNHDLDDVCKLISLENLNLNGCYRINERGLEKVATKLTNLKILNIANCNCTDLALHHISRHLTHLETFNVRNSPQITNSGISTLVTGVSKLKHLNINDCKSLTSNGLECLLSVKSLESLVCDTDHISDKLEKDLESTGCIVTRLNPDMLKRGV